MCERNTKPEIYCSIVLLFEQDEDAVQASEFFGKIGLKDYELRQPKLWMMRKLNLDYPRKTYIDIATVRYELFWNLDDALGKMFRKIDAHLKEIKQVIDTYHCESLIDICFYKYDTYPALSISGENMAKIRFLEADIEIDPYDMSD